MAGYGMGQSATSANLQKQLQQAELERQQNQQGAYGSLMY